MRSLASRARAAASRTARAVAILVRHGGIPRPIRRVGALGLLPVPGPLDEIVLLAVALVLVVFYRPQLREAWERAGGVPSPMSPGGGGAPHSAASG